MYDTGKRNNRIVLLVGLAMVAGLFVVLFKKFGFLLGSNDDILLRSLASGNYTGKPEAHLIYMMYPLGLIFKGLYSILPDVMWFDGFVTFINFLCVFLIIVRMGRVFERLSNKLISMVLTFTILMIVDVKFLVMNQYTVLAGLCAATAILWAATYNFKSRSRLAQTIIIFCLIMSLWIRKETFFMALPILVLAVAFRVFEGNETTAERTERLMDTLAPVVTLVLIVALSLVTEVLAYKSPEWKEFKDYNEARTRIYDYNLLPDYYDCTDFYNAQDLSEYDYMTMREYDLGLVRFNDDTGVMNALADKAEEINDEWAQYYSVSRKVINETVGAMYGLNGSSAGILVTILFFVLLIFLLVKDEKTAGLLVTLALLYEWAFVGYFISLDRLPERVTQGLLLELAAFLVSVFVIVVKKDKPQRQPSFMWQLLLGILAIIILGASGLYSLRTMMDRNVEERARANEWKEINTYIKSNPENVYVLNTSMCASRAGLLFTEGESEAFNSIRAGVWTLHSPVETSHRERLSVKDVNLTEALINMDNVFYVMSSDKTPGWLDESLLRPEVCDEFTTEEGNSYTVYSVGNN